MAELPIIYTVRLDLTDEVREEFDAWAAGSHIQDLLNAGLLSALRFRSTRGEPEYMHLYELPNVELLSTEKYAAVSKNDDTGRKLHHGTLNHSAALYKQEVAVNVPETPREFSEPRSMIGGIKSKALATVRMDVSEGDGDELIRWHKEEHIPLMMAVDGVVNARLCRRVGEHPVTPCREPGWFSIYELDSLDVLKDPKVKAANETDWAKAMHGKTTDVRFSMLERITPP